MSVRVKTLQFVAATGERIEERRLFEGVRGL
jgi:hypothetical protein